MKEVSRDYTISEAIISRPVTTPEPSERYFAVIKHKPAAPGDPIAWLATIYRGVAVESYWRGSEDEAQDALDQYLSQHHDGEWLKDDGA